MTLEDLKILRRLLITCLATILATVMVAAATAAAPGAAPQPTNFRMDVNTGFDFSQGECCAFWYFGTPTAVKVPRVGPATLTTFFIQCFAAFVCSPPNSQLTLTFETPKGDTLTLLGYAPNLGTSTSNGSTFELAVEGVWSVTSPSIGRFAHYVGSGTFSFFLAQPFGSIGGSEHVTLAGTLEPN